MDVECFLLRLPIVSWVAWLSYPALQKVLALGGFQIIHLDGEKIVDRETFFARARRDLPLNPRKNRKK